MPGIRMAALAALLLSAGPAGAGCEACLWAEEPNPDPNIRPGAARSVVGTWRVQLADVADEAKFKLYTFTADGRVTVAPGQVCRYRVERDVLAVDCAGAARESARGTLERWDADTLVWRVDDKIVRLERQAGVKEQQ